MKAVLIVIDIKSRLSRILHAPDNHRRNLDRVTAFVVYLQLLAVASGQGGIARVLDLDHRDVGFRVGADDLRGKLDTIVERDDDLVRPVAVADRITSETANLQCRFSILVLSDPFCLG